MVYTGKNIANSSKNPQFVPVMCALCMHTPRYSWLAVLQVVQHMGFIAQCTTCVCVCSLRALCCGQHVAHAAFQTLNGSLQPRSLYNHSF